MTSHPHRIFKRTKIRPRSISDWSVTFEAAYKRQISLHSLINLLSNILEKKKKKRKAGSERLQKISIRLISQVRNWRLVFDTQATGVCVSLPETQSGFI